MDNNDREFKNRIIELADRAYKEGRYIYTNFLNPSEISKVHELKKELSHVGFCWFGGMELSERAVVCFGNEELFGYEPYFPITVIKIEPRMKKFAEVLSHRDILGALMNQGIERDTMGDILIKDNVAYVFILDTMADYIIENITSVRHTPVKTSVCENPEELKNLSPETKQMDLIVSSNRCDAIISKIYNLSREQALVLFREGKVFIDGRESTGNARPIKEGEIVSVRGYGKFRFIREGGTTKKERLYVSIEKYV